MKCPCVGDLDEILYIERYLKNESTAGGGERGEWIFAYSPLADLERKWGMERWMSNQVEPQKWIDAVITYNPIILRDGPLLRCKVDNEIYNIRSVIRDPKKMWLFIKAEAGPKT